MSEVNRLVAGLLTEHFHDIWITGEISGLRAYPSGHRYFVLKDDTSRIDAVCFRTSARRLKFELEDGLQVVAHGRVDLYQPQGRYQVVLDSIEPAGLGALQKAFEQLKKKLAAEGLFDDSRKKPLPGLPRVVGIVTSPAGAAIHDMLRTFRLQGAGFRVLLYPTRVQGDGAAAQIAEGVRALNELGGVDVIIVGRGGGSIEDLWCFNEEAVARAIAGSMVPVVSGVGHEVDFTIADFAADVRAATPTAAAQVVAAGWAESRDRLRVTGDALVEGIEQVLLDRGRRLEALVQHRAFERARGAVQEARYRVQVLLAAIETGTRDRLRTASRGLVMVRERLYAQSPIERLLCGRTRLQRISDRLESRLERGLRQRRAWLGEHSARLDVLSPLASLGRGYSICRGPDGSVVSRVEQVKPADAVSVRVSDGSIDCRVEAAVPLPSDKEGD